MTEVPAILNGLTIHWAGVDDTTPAGCSLVSTVHLGLPTTYVLRDGRIIGRIEIDGDRQVEADRG